MKKLKKSNAKKVVKPADYEDRYCAFIDFLGFANAVQSGQWSPDHVLSAMKKAKKVTDGDDIQVTQFSDSLVLSVEADSEWGFESIVSTTMFLIIELVQHDVLLRGGITRGQLYHEDNFAFGPAFIDAYRLEQTANVPRVILDVDIEKHAKWPSTMNKKEIKGYLDKSIPRDFDGWRFVDYFSDELITNFDYGHEGWEEHRKKLHALVAKHKGTKNPSLVSKYGWLEAQLKAGEQ